MIKKIILIVTGLIIAIGGVLVVIILDVKGVIGITSSISNLTAGVCTLVGLFIFGWGILQDPNKISQTKSLKTTNPWAVKAPKVEVKKEEDKEIPKIWGQVSVGG